MNRLFPALFIALSGIIPAPAIAESIFPLSIPSECIALAQREGAPVIINNRYEAVKAKLKLARLSGRDPLVAQCRAAVERARVAMHATGTVRPVLTSNAVP